MRRRYFNSKLINNKIIIYTSADNLIVVPYMYNFGANAITNIINNNIGKITFDGDVTTIGERAFFDCTSLTSVTIPDSVTTIGQDAFYNCSSLTSVNIPDSVTTIGEWAFAYCDSLTSVNIPDSVTTIGDNAFYNCRSLTSVYCKATTPPSLGGTYVFDNNGSGRKIYVPTGSVNAYKSATNWSEYADAIVGYDFGDGGGNLITFTIDDTEYQAEEGMTWGEWVDSEYNVINASIYLLSSGVGYITLGKYSSSPIIICYSNYNYVNTTQEVITNHNYITSVGGGGGI